MTYAISIVQFRGVGAQKIKLTYATIYDTGTRRVLPRKASSVVSADRGYFRCGLQS